MSCNCKNEKKIDVKSESKNKISFYFLKILIYMIFLLLLPVIIVAFMIIGFKVFVLSESIDIKPLLVRLAKSFSIKDEDEDEDYENITEDDLIMVDVEDITNKKY